MKKKEFQNLPSTETPINAENLNEMQDNIEESCVIVSPTEPTTNEKVWIQKGENLFNKNNVLYNSWIDETGQPITSSSSNVVTEVISVKPNTEYKLSSLVRTNGEIGNVWVTIASFNKNNEFNKYIFDDNATETQLFITGENDYYIRVALGTNVIDNIKLEENIEKKIYCKNDNGVFEEFVNAEKNKPINIITGVEFETGRIIDGKKEYGKRINLGALPNAGTKEVETGLSNVDFVRLEGCAKYEYGVWAPIPYIENGANSYYNVSIKITQYGEAIQLRCDADQSAFNAYVTLYYTKN